MRVVICAACQIAIYVFTSMDYGRLSLKQWGEEWMRDSRGCGLCILGSFIAWLPLPIRIAGVAALLPILFAWGLRIWDWPAIAESIHVGNKSFRAMVTQTDVRAVILLVVTSGLCIIALV